ncbi:hypothetical protein PG911_10515 [Tenacibaculum ovolyticum]|uniref:hypothetical protein n=1 Tax=Tenacibaculum ovolyticum TaxID=104270 RepID=UPI0022F3B1F2|nr:hypothetical protein [Tenacibaculum ovolyticum]WBX75090.1 hypothetical protein PG911_10515 [Tenacibaculum ovolyticum]
MRGFFKKKKIQSSSLSYSLLIITVIGVFLFTLIMVVSFSNRIFSKLEIENELIDRAESTLNYVLSNYNMFDKHDKKINIKGIGHSLVRKNKWGALKMLQYQVVFKNDTIKETLFIEDTLRDSISLVLVKNNKHFFLGGKCSIEGDIKVPNEEIKELNLSGYTNRLTHRGSVGKALNKLPIINNFYLDDDVINLDEEKAYEESYNSFFNKPKKIIFTSKKGISGLSLSGNYILESQQEIFIKKNNKLNDVIIKSPIVRIEEGFKGVIQVLATKKVVIEKNVILKYPSVIYVSGKKNEVEIKVGENSEIIGLVVAISNNYKENKVLISKNSIIAGSLYCSGEVEFKGEMYGTIYAHEFYLNTGESEYQNALLNFNLYLLPEFFQKISIIDSGDNVCKIIKRQK